MAGMLELPPLPLDAVEGREPVMRVRHAITNTNYYVEIYGSPAAGVEPEMMRDPDEDRDVNPGVCKAAEVESRNEDEEVFVGEMTGEHEEETLMSAIPAAEESLSWCPTSRLASEPLTGLARKVLQRMGVMAVPRPSIR